MTDLTAEQRAELELDADEGVLLQRIVGAPGQRAGLQAGDVVLMVGRVKVGTVAAFNAAVKAIKAGEPAMLLIRREGQSQFVTVSPAALD